MYFNEVIQSIIDFVQTNTIGTLAAGFILVFLLFWRSRVLRILLFITFAAIAVMHLFAKLSATGLGNINIPFLE
jgi:hypothetical protein